MTPHLGAEEAAQLQKEMTEYTVRQARQTDAHIEIRYTGGTEHQMRAWLGDDLDYADQGDGNLGERMERAFADHIAIGAERVIIIGSDCPSNDWKNMMAAFLALDDADCVIGPARDGGYYLIGLNHLEIRGHRRQLKQGAVVGGGVDPAFIIFQNIDWGGDMVYEQTLKAAVGLKVELLKPLNDVDLPGDIPKKISVIIPALNEEDQLPQTLEKVRMGFNVETLVVDGGSTDGTRSMVPDCLTCLDGRAGQQNRGAKAATGALLLFLHADTELPDGWDWIVRETLSDPSVALGAFSFKIRESIAGQKFIEDTANWRSRFGKLPFGDQGLFIRKQTFDAAGGFPDLPIMEDYAFVRKIRPLGRIVTVPQTAITSGRRWQRHGVFTVTLINKLMILGYHLGVPPAKLAAYYRKRSSDFLF